MKIGNYLIVDNAAVYVAECICEKLSKVCNDTQVNLRFLPAYFPELNPCELVFSIMKHHLRYWRGSDRFWLEIINTASTITYEQMACFYEHCLNVE